MNATLDEIREEVANINEWSLRFAPKVGKDTRQQIVHNVKEHVIAIIDKYRESEGEG